MITRDWYNSSDTRRAKVVRGWTAEQNKASEEILNENGTTIQQTLYEYDTKANRTKMTQKKLTSTLDADLVTTFAYNGGNRRTSMTDANGNTTTYTYTGDGDIDVQTDPEGYSVDNTYNTFRLPTQFADARGKVTTYTYTLFGQLETETRPDGSKITDSHDPWGRVMESRATNTSWNQTDANNKDQITRTTYDDLGRVKEIRVRMGTPVTSDDNDKDLRTGKTYDRDGNLTSEQDPLNFGSAYKTEYTIDRRGRVATVALPPGDDQAGDASRPCQAFEYDEAGNQTKVRMAIARTSGSGCPGTQWSDLVRTFDNRHLKKEEKLQVSGSDYSGATELVTAWEYDAAGRVSRATDRNGQYINITNDDVGRKYAVGAAVVLADYNSQNDCHGIDNAVCGTLKWRYDEVGNVTKEIVPRGAGETQTEVERNYTYFKNNRLKTKQNELGKIWSYTYDGNGNQLTETDPLIHTTTRTYDDRNRVLTVTDAGSNTTTYTYDTFGNRATLTDPNGNVTSYSYDKNNRVTSIIDGAGKTSSFVLDKNSNRTSLTDPRGTTQLATYDRLNRILSEQTPSAYACTPTCTETARTASYTYTLDGLKDVGTDFNGDTAAFGYDSARRVQSLTYSKAGTPDVSYTYDRAGNRTAMKEDGTTTAQYSYDELNRLRVETRNPGAGQKIIQYKYDRRDATQVVYPDGKTVAHTYDAGARLDYLDDWRPSGTKRTDFGYDDANRKTSQSFPSGAYSQWQYDNANRLTQVEHKTAQVGGSTIGRYSYTYDKAGNRLTQTDYDGTNTTTQLFDYDHLHRLVAEVPRSAYSPTSYSYDAAGNRTALGTGGALVEDNAGSGVSYSGGNTSVNNSNASGGSYTRISGTGNYVDFSFSGVAASFVYSTDAEGGTVRLFLDPAGGGDGTLLDEINQCTPSTTWQVRRSLSGFSNASHTLRVKFVATCPGAVDNHVNVDAFRAYTESKSYLHDDDNRLKEIKVGGATDTTFKYDQNGSMTEKTVGTNTTSHAYDAARRLKTVTPPSGSVVSFTYDGNGARTKKTVGTAETTYVNDTRNLTQVLQETRSDKTLTYLPGVLQHDSSQSGNADEWAYFHADAQNNRALTNNTTQLMKTWEYDPFGQVRSETGSIASDFQYAGEQRDPETGLLNLRARHYDPAIGRFISRDLLSGEAAFPQTYNRFTYALNNPITLVDRSGQDAWDPGRARESDGQGGSVPGSFIALDRKGLGDYVKGMLAERAGQTLQANIAMLPLTDNTTPDVSDAARSRSENIAIIEDFGIGIANPDDFTDDELEEIAATLVEIADTLAADRPEADRQATGRAIFKEIVGITYNGQNTGLKITLKMVDRTGVYDSYGREAPGATVPRPVSITQTAVTITQSFEINLTHVGSGIGWLAAHELGHVSDWYSEDLVASGQSPSPLSHSARLGSGGEAFADAFANVLAPNAQRPPGFAANTTGIGLQDPARALVEQISFEARQRIGK